jgi:hypothetical protein
VLLQIDLDEKRSHDDANPVHLHSSIVLQLSDTIRSALNSATMSDIATIVKSSVSLVIARYGTDFDHACGQVWVAPQAVAYYTWWRQGLQHHAGKTFWIYSSFPHSTFEDGLSSKIRRCIETKALVDAQIVGYEMQLPHAVAMAEIMATCLACLIDLGESLQGTAW